MDCSEPLLRSCLTRDFSVIHEEGACNLDSTVVVTVVSYMRWLAIYGLKLKAIYCVPSHSLGMRKLNKI